MHISPVNNVKFGAVYVANEKCNDSQAKMIEGIKNSLEYRAPFDKKNRSYNDYIDQNGYDIMLVPAKESKVRTYLVIQPRTYEQEMLRDNGIFRCDDNLLAGEYDEKHAFDINDVMELVNYDMKATRDIMLGGILPVAGFVLLAVVTALLKFCNPKQQEPKVFQKAVQDTTMVVKDTIKMFN